MKQILLSIIVAIALISCGTTMNLGGKVKKVEIGMTKHKLISTLGKSYSVRGAVKTPEGTLETLSFYDTLYGYSYIFNLLDGKLVEWFEETTPPVQEVIIEHNYNRKR